MIDIVLKHHGIILSGFLTTIVIVGLGFVIGSLFGVVLGCMRNASTRWLRWSVATYVSVIRNTPFLIQAMLLFALLGVLRIRIAPEVVGAASVALYTAGYMSEIIRGALKTVSAGQWEASRSLGLKPLQTFRLVVFPQLLSFAVPASTNLLATVTKESAFLSALSVAELTFSGQVVIAQTFAVFEIWAIIAILYLLLTMSLFSVSAWFEQHRLRASILS